MSTMHADPIQRSHHTAFELAKTIGVIKNFILGLLALAGLIVFVSLAANQEVALALAAVVYFVLNGLMVWVFFGWLQHTLTALLEISDNTRK